MYRVAVIDDEDLIVQGLVRAMPWAKYDCEVVATASDGVAAIEMVGQKQPDILFTDIRMPNMDGLSMIAALRSEYPDLQVTILSGYPNFDYAQRAISLGVARYVLKPSRFVELEEALEQMVKNLQEIAARRARAAAKAQEKAALAALQGEEVQAFAETALAAAQDAESAQGDGTQEEEAESAPISAPDSPAVENAQNFIVHNAQAYIREHYAEKLTLGDVAAQVYVSQWHLSKLISRYTKQSFFDLLNGARIDKAKELLCDPALRVWEISEMVGFAEVTHFSRIFKKIVGMSANEYRSQILCK
ncbi:MAG: response regulator [Faecalibacterium sp.]